MVLKSQAVSNTVTYGFCLLQILDTRGPCTHHHNSYHFGAAAAWWLLHTHVPGTTADAVCTRAVSRHEHRDSAEGETSNGPGDAGRFDSPHSLSRLAGVWSRSS